MKDEMQHNIWRELNLLKNVRNFFLIHIIIVVTRFIGVDRW